jgi:hypothetical protein
MTRLLVAIYLIEAGLLLIAAPWTEWWQYNFFADQAPWLRPLMATIVVRGGVVLAGVVTTVAGISDLRDAIFGRIARRLPSESGQTPDA